MADFTKFKPETNDLHNRMLVWLTIDSNWEDFDVAKEFFDMEDQAKEFFKEYYVGFREVGVTTDTIMWNDFIPYVEKKYDVSFEHLRYRFKKKPDRDLFIQAANISNNSHLTQEVCLIINQALTAIEKKKFKKWLLLARDERVNAIYSAEKKAYRRY